MLSKSAIFLSVSLLLASSSAHATDRMDDNVIVPGKRVGFITKNTSEEELKRLLPAGSVHRILHDNGDGSYSCATEIYPASKKSAIIIWKSDSAIYTANNRQEDQKRCDNAPSRNNPESIEIFQYRGDRETLEMKEASVWHTKEGVHVGMNLAELEAVNRAAVDVDVSESCFAGGINSWNGGILEKHQGELGSMIMDYPDVEKFKNNEKFRNSGSINSSLLPLEVKKQISIRSLTIDFPAD
ncbi:MAG: hypothetical protein ACOYK8_04025 [Alphaproteobacteria bacterium]